MIRGTLRNLAVAGSWFALAWPLAGYPLVLSLLGRARREPAARSGTLPSLSVILPTFNESANIAARLHNLACGAYDGALSIIVVDSGSTDDTAQLAEAYARQAPLAIRVIRESERRGKAAAINTAIAAAASDLLVITDAPTVFEPDALARVASAFCDPRVGAATGYFEVSGEGGRLRDEEQRFWRIRNTLRTLEARVDSTPFLSGELCAFRRDLDLHLDEDTLADDMNIALQVRRKGYRVVVVPGARFSERRTDSSRELIETKSRRAAGGIQELLRHRDMVFAPRYGFFGLLILPSAVLYYLPLRVPAAIAVILSVRSVMWRLPARSPASLPRCRLRSARSARSGCCSSMSGCLYWVGAASSPGGWTCAGFRSAAPANLRP